MDEKILWIGRRSRKSFLKYYFSAVVFFVLTVAMLINIIPNFLPETLDNMITYALFFLGVIFLLVAEVKRLIVKYIITNERIIENRGIFNITHDSIPYEMIEKMVLNQSLIKRILKIGDMIVDTGEKQLVLESLDNPQKIEDLIYKMREDAWKERYIERGRPPSNEDFGKPI
ncbi:MAG: PH domain-containing protein [Candidatus Aenigmarchaeota archaeon]|nr:PH domain-containing protein [Candidatus Aenigmarchaeota archaeon]